MTEIKGFDKINRLSFRPLTHRRYDDAMTIALGFFYSDGVLVGADNQFTVGAAKISGQKTDRLSASWGTVVASFAGNSDYAAATFAECKHLKETKAFKEDQIQAMRNVLELRYKNNVFEHPRYKSGEYDYSFLFGVHLKKGSPGARLYKTTEGVMRPLSTFDCIGSGDLFGIDLMHSMYSYQMNHKRAVFFAAYVLSHASMRAQYVGDKFAFQVLTHDGSILDGPFCADMEQIAFHANNVGNWFVQECQRFLMLHSSGDIVKFAKNLTALDARATYIRTLWDDLAVSPPGHPPTTIDPSRLPPWLE